MPFFIAGFAFFFPRLVLILLFFFTTFLSSAFQTLLWPILGFIFMPYTTLAYAAAINYGGAPSPGCGSFSSSWPSCWISASSAAAGQPPHAGSPHGL